MACISIGTGISRWPVLLTIQVCMHASTGYTPFYLIHGHEAHLSVNVLCGRPDQKDLSHCEYVANMPKRFGHVFEKVSDRTGQKQVRQKTYYDKKTPREVLPTGSLVWLRYPVPRRKGYNCKKLHQAWRGPFEIIQRLSDVTYRIRGDSTWWYTLIA